MVAIGFLLMVSLATWGRRSDRRLERRFHLAFPLLVAAAATAASTILDDPMLKMVVAGFRIFASMPVFWKDSTGTYAGGLLALAAVSVVAMIIVLALEHDRSLERLPTAIDGQRVSLIAKTPVKHGDFTGDSDTH